MLANPPQLAYLHWLSLSFSAVSPPSSSLQLSRTHIIGLVAISHVLDCSSFDWHSTGPQPCSTTQTIHSPNADQSRRLLDKRYEMMGDRVSRAVLIMCSRGNLIGMHEHCYHPPIQGYSQTITWEKMGGEMKWENCRAEGECSGRVSIAVILTLNGRCIFAGCERNLTGLGVSVVVGWA